jgi:transposase
MGEAAAVEGQSAEAFIQTVKRRTKRKYNAEDKIRIVLEGLKREVSVSELCRREGIHAFVYYTWVKHFMEAGKARLKGDFKRAANESQVEDLRRENGRLKMMLAENLLESELVKKSLLGEEPAR